MSWSNNCPIPVYYWCRVVEVDYICMVSTSNRLKTGKTEVYLDEKEILRISTNKNAYLELSDAVDSLLLAKHLSGGNPVLILADLREKKHIHPEAFQLFNQANTPHHHKAKAILVTSALSKYVSNLTRKRKKRYPVKTFTSEQKAVNWLVQYK